MKTEKVWHGVMPEVCDLCQQPITNKFIDGKTISGPWALMCTKCYDEVGVGLGLGKGQEYSTLIKAGDILKEKTKLIFKLLKELDNIARAYVVEELYIKYGLSYVKEDEELDKNETKME